MTKEKYAEVLSLYRKFFEKHDIPVKKIGDGVRYPDRTAVLSHCRAMLGQMELFLSQNKISKLDRWLGFMQGCFFALGLYNLGELKNHNRP